MLSWLLCLAFGDPAEDVSEAPRGAGARQGRGPAWEPAVRGKGPGTGDVRRRGCASAAMSWVPWCVWTPPQGAGAECPEWAGWVGSLAVEAQSPSPRQPAGPVVSRGRTCPSYPAVHLFLVIDCLISSLCERKQISSNLQQ